MSRERYQYIPTATLDEQQRTEAAQAWGDAQRRETAQRWADMHTADAAATLGPLADQYPGDQGSAPFPEPVQPPSSPVPASQEGMTQPSGAPGEDPVAKTLALMGGDTGQQVGVSDTAMGGLPTAPVAPQAPQTSPDVSSPAPDQGGAVGGSWANQTVRVPGTGLDQPASPDLVGAAGTALDAGGDALIGQVERSNADYQAWRGASRAIIEKQQRGEPVSQEEYGRTVEMAAPYALAMTGEPLANVGGKIAGKVAGSVGAEAIAKTEAMFADAASHANRPVGDRLSTLGTYLTRKLTDAGVDLSNLEQDAARVLGRPLNADEMASVQSRLNPFYTAKIAVDEGVRPALRGLDDADAAGVRNILTWKGNVDVAAAIGNRVESAAAKLERPPGLTDIGPPQAAMTKVGDLAGPQPSVLGQEAAMNRRFSGGLDAASSQAALDEFARRVGPQKMADLEQRAQQIVDFNKAELERDVAAGLIPRETADRWLQEYPNYTPVVIADYLKEQGRSISGSGRSLSVTSRGVKTLTTEGTNRARLDPIATSIDAAYQGEALRRRNAAFNALHTLTQSVPELQDIFQVVKGGYTGATRHETSVQGFVNGELHTITTPFPEMAQVLKQEGGAVIPGIGPAMGLFKELITGKNPTFLVGNAAIDAPIAVLNQAAREGGIQHALPVLVDLFRGYADAFKGLTRGEYGGAWTRGFLKEGGGMGFYGAPTAQTGANEVARLRRSSVLEVNSPADALRLIKDLTSMEWVKGIGERVELGPRAMAYKRDLGRGLSTEQAVLGGRTVTVDFAQGGSLIKFLNQAIPFLNPAVQGVATTARIIRDAPRGALLSYGPGVVGPALAIEAWNRADPERSKAYDDVPDYIKDRGLVIMLPGAPPVDEKGEPHPQAIVVNLRQLAPVAMLTRNLFDRVVGVDDHRTAASLLGGATTAVNPVPGLSAAVPPIASTALELQQDRDFYRRAPIATARGDERASALAGGIASGINTVAATRGAYPQVRPSQADYAIRDTTGGVGEMVSGASDLLAGRTKQSGTPQDIPVVGGFARRLVRGDTGQDLTTARDERLSPAIQKALYDAGMKPDVAVVPAEYRKIPLQRAEQAAFQRATNQHLEELLGPIVADPGFARLPADAKKKLVDRMVAAARQVAGAEVLGTISGDQINTRLDRVITKKAG